jgi:uncharacterized membrane protein
MLTKNRLEAFSDGVFAIAITLLVIEIHPPELEPGESLAHGLGQQWPDYLGYVLSFLVLGVMWLNHHRILEPVRHVDGLVLVLNLNLLLWAVLIPFPTAVVADFLRDGGADAETAVALYGGVILMAAIGFTVLFVAISRPGIVEELPPPGLVRAARIRFGVGVGVYGAAFLLSWVSPWAALAAHATMAAYYLTEQSSRLTVASAGPGCCSALRSRQGAQQRLPAWREPIARGQALRQPHLLELADVELERRAVTAGVASEGRGHDPWVPLDQPQCLERPRMVAVEACQARSERGERGVVQLVVGARHEARRSVPRRRAGPSGRHGRRGRRRGRRRR